MVPDCLWVSDPGRNNIESAGGTMTITPESVFWDGEGVDYGLIPTLILGIMYPSEDDNGQIHLLPGMDESEVDDHLSKLHQLYAFEPRNAYKVKVNFERA